jgi:predicted nucleic acid-binding protein
MEGIVVDASVALVWCYPDEHSDFAYRVLDALEYRQMIVPSLWAIEVANALIVGERRRRLTAADVAHFLDLLDGLSIQTDLETASRALGETMALARAHELSAYDATYLELAMRQALPLATLDERLRKAGEAVGAVIFA